MVDAHLENGKNKTCDETLVALRQEWSSNIPNYGLSSTYVRACIQSCGYQDERIVLLSRVAPLDVEMSSIFEDIQIQFKTRLNATPKVAAHSIIYGCHRAKLQRKRGNRKRRSRLSKKCGCSFRVSITKTSIYGVLGPHTSHDPTRYEEIFHLPVHPNVMECCMDDLFDVGCMRHC